VTASEIRIGYLLRPLYLEMQNKPRENGLDLGIYFTVLQFNNGLNPAANT
jgi:hypothetical protein